jgi:hypothetical protein
VRVQIFSDLHADVSSLPPIEIVDGVNQPAALTSTDHGLDSVTQEPACDCPVAQFARALEVFPGNLE